VLGVARSDAHQQVDLSAHPVGLHDFGDGRDRLGDAGQFRLADGHAQHRLDRKAQRERGDGAFERLEDATAFQARQSGLHGVAGQAEPLGERDDGGTVIVGERVQQVEVDAVKRSHTAQLYQEMSVRYGQHAQCK